MKTLATAMREAGYVIDPNRKECWYPGAGGLPAFPTTHHTQVTGDRIRVFTLKFFGEPYTRRSWHDEVTVAVFDSAEAFIKACPTKSEPGLPPFANSWD